MAGRSGGVSWGGWSWRVGRSTTRGLVLLLSCGPCSLSCSGSCTRSRSRACPRAGPVGGRSGAGRAGKWGWVGTAGKRYGERGAESAGRRASRTRGRGARGRRLSGLRSSGGGAGGGRHTCVAGVEDGRRCRCVGRVALSLRVYQGRRRACRAVGASGVSVAESSGGGRRRPCRVVGFDPRATVNRLSTILVSERGGGASGGRERGGVSRARYDRWNWSAYERGMVYGELRREH